MSEKNSLELQGRNYSYEDLNFIVWDMFNGMTEQEQEKFLTRYKREEIDRLISEIEDLPEE